VLELVGDMNRQPGGRLGNVNPFVGLKHWGWGVPHTKQRMCGSGGMKNGIAPQVNPMNKAQGHKCRNGPWGGGEEAKRLRSGECDAWVRHSHREATS